MRGLGLAMAAALLFGVACGGGSSGGSGQARARQPVAPEPAAEATATEDAAQQTASVEYHYHAEGKRDPFRSFVLEHAREMAEANVERGPLEQFDLSQLDVVAVVWGADNRRALVADPSGRGYIVKEGTPIGKNDGRVVRIDDNLVLVRETYTDYLGDRTTKEIEMRVRPSQGG